ncbi:hypothetical protein SpCBS45565_g08490 [Spizellomyces sp. 'palustris']|nr:hypothetical protein SpCBS45565_g08490 [Spizellomyces sp. 'palustris']
MTSTSPGSRPGEHISDSGADNPPSPTPSSSTPNSRKVSAKRAEQNRAAQRAFRERKQRYIKELEVKAALLDARNGQLQDSENRHRELRNMVERLTRERDVRIKERELWWREREEVFRIVDALRRDLEQLHGENERLKEVVFGLWQESRETSASGNDETEGCNGDDDGADAESGGREKEIALTQYDRHADKEKAPSIDISAKADVEASATSNMSLGNVAFATLIEHGTSGSSGATTGNSLSEALLVDLKNRISYWDAEREALYRTSAFPPMSVAPNASLSMGMTTPPYGAHKPTGDGRLPSGPAVSAHASGPSSQPSIAGGERGGTSNGVAVSSTVATSIPNTPMAALTTPSPSVSAPSVAVAAAPNFMDTLFSTILSASGPFNGIPGVPSIGGVGGPFVPLSVGMGPLTATPAALSAVVTTGKLAPVTGSPAALPATPLAGINGTNYFGKAGSSPSQLQPGAESQS